MTSLACCDRRRLDLSENALTSLDALSGLADLTWIKATGNQVTSLGALNRLEKLKVLNLSENKLAGELVGLAGLVELQALVLSNNGLTSADGLRRLTNLNTLVLSNNKLEKVPPLQGLSKLTKLSLSNNQIVAFPALPSDCAHVLRELRLAHNRITRLPLERLSVLGKLEILDLGHNLLDRAEVVGLASSTASTGLRSIKQLNLLGNTGAIGAAGAAALQEVVVAYPKLKLLNNKKPVEAVRHAATAAPPLSKAAAKAKAEAEAARRQAVDTGDEDSDGEEQDGHPATHGGSNGSSGQTAEQVAEAEAAAAVAARRGAAEAAELLSCSKCGENKPRTAFSRKMLTKPQAKRRCAGCTGDMQAKLGVGAGQDKKPKPLKRQQATGGPNTGARLSDSAAARARAAGGHSATQAANANQAGGGSSKGETTEPGAAAAAYTVVQTGQSAPQLPSKSKKKKKLGKDGLPLSRAEKKLLKQQKYKQEQLERPAHERGDDAEQTASYHAALGNLNALENGERAATEPSKPAMEISQASSDQKDEGKKEKKKKKKRKRDQDGVGKDEPNDGIVVGAAAYGLGGIVSTADGGASAGPGTAKRSKHDRKAERAVESGVVAVKVVARKADKGVKKSGGAAEAKSPASVAVAAPMFAAQLALGMGGSSGWD